ncbi:MAG: hypothetical protein ACP5M9_00075 [Candidatus Micrarchaeia archaeon]
MPSNYENATKKIVPLVRGILILELKNKYNQTEEEIAKKLGVTQAAISKRLRTLKSDIEKNTYYKEIDKTLIESYAKKIVDGKESADRCICAACKSINDFGCEFSSVKNDI